MGCVELWSGVTRSAAMGVVPLFGGCVVVIMGSVGSLRVRGVARHVVVGVARHVIVGVARSVLRRRVVV